MTMTAWSTRNRWRRAITRRLGVLNPAAFTWSRRLQIRHGLGRRLPGKVRRLYTPRRAAPEAPAGADAARHLSPVPLTTLGGREAAEPA